MYSGVLGKVPVTGQQRGSKRTPVMRPSVTCIQVCFSAKEIQDRHAVLSERAVLIRVHRINAPTSERSASAGTGTNCPNDAVEQEMPNEARKKQSERETFFFERFCRFLAH